MRILALDHDRTVELQILGYIGCLSPCAEAGHDAAYEKVEAFIQDLVPMIQTTTGPAIAGNSSSSAEPAVVVARAEVRMIRELKRQILEP
jgi:hypothetical protein